MARWARIAGIIALLVTFITGCSILGSNGVEPAKGNQSQENPPFTLLLNREITTVDSHYDPQIVQGDLYHHISVYAANGRQVALDVAKQAVLFSAYWCPHCQRTLVLLDEHQLSMKTLPVIVSTGFAPGTSLQTAKRLTAEEKRGLHLSGMTVYYLLGSGFRQFVSEGFPTLAYESKGRVNLLVGEHTLQVWQHVFSNNY
ncbi:hypothetical protein D2Q93_00085 [Alicyclobacillaceae bacterium I2511]|jgi:thiol-disulfide isomerase/thioredoxin|nr:hypothetical protein D2Q93_00085 [Alicyclobacillaceae bacterium I2511]